MHELNGFGLTLKLVDENTAEQVRLWRNDPSIAQFMEYKENITPEMQQIWLKKMLVTGDLFYVVETQNQLIGTIHLSNFNSITASAEAGIFIGDPSFSGTGITLGASLLLLDFAFQIRKLRAVNAKIHTNNKVAEQYNQLLGFQKVKMIDENFNLWELEKNNYFIRKERLLLWL